MNIKTQIFDSKKSSGYQLLIASIAFWVAFGIIATTKSSLYNTLKGIPTYWPHLSLHHLANGATWILLTPAIYYLVKRFSKSKSPIAFIFLASIPFAVGQSLISISADILIRWSFGFIPISKLTEVSSNLPLILNRTYENLFFYFLISSIIYIVIHRFQTGSAESYDVAQGVAHEKPFPTRMFLKDGSGFNSIDTSEVLLIKAEGNYLRIYHGSSFSMTRHTLKCLEDKFNPTFFYRLHRSYIVNINFISRISPLYNGEYKLTLQNGFIINTTATYRHHVRRLKSNFSQQDAK